MANRQQRRASKRRKPNKANDHDMVRQMGKFFDALQNLTQEYARMRDEVDDEYANDKLRQAAERVTGVDIRYLYEDELKRCSK